MAETSSIEWCDATFNPWEGCTKVGPGCDNCYAETRNARFAGGQAINWGPGAPRRRTTPANWNKPKAWNANAAAFLAEHGRRQRVFCASLADVFDNAVPDEWRMDLFKLIAATPNLDWLLLTKRIGNVRQYTQRDGLAFDLICDGRVWLGATITSQEEADRDIPKLLAVPARVRFLSMEPLLGPVDLRLQRPAREDDRQDMDGYCSHITTSAGAGIHWVIVGGESGPGARPMHPSWASSLREQCAAAGVPFLFKQWGEWGTAAYSVSTGAPVFRQFDSYQMWVHKACTWVNGGICLDTDGLQLKNGGDMARARDAGKFPVTVMHRVGKKAAGRLLDGCTHDGFPAKEGA